LKFLEQEIEEIFSLHGSLIQNAQTLAGAFFPQQGFY
jgi:hypothetical protein